MRTINVPIYFNYYKAEPPIGYVAIKGYKVPDVFEFGIEGEVIKSHMDKDGNKVIDKFELKSVSIIPKRNMKTKTVSIAELEDPQTGEVWLPKSEKRDRFLKLLKDIKFNGKVYSKDNSAVKETKHGDYTIYELGDEDEIFVDENLIYFWQFIGAIESDFCRK